MRPRWGEPQEIVMDSTHKILAISDCNLYHQEYHSCRSHGGEDALYETYASGSYWVLCFLEWGDNFGLVACHGCHPFFLVPVDSSRLTAQENPQNFVRIYTI
ncbi:uncharacterized protein G2W53_026756 [Senna tora]|uniref:Uncharacterized protein n=1 Tax=Senna tora TaxID=362788 RepID=A0A834WJ21_9FABA|nr:uncharacterized protein G2W53_026756 [Senna tora]